MWSMSPINVRKSRETGNIYGTQDEDKQSKTHNIICAGHHY